MIVKHHNITKDISNFIAYQYLPQIPQKRTYKYVRFNFMKNIFCRIEKYYCIFDRKQSNISCIMNIQVKTASVM